MGTRPPRKVSARPGGARIRKEIVDPSRVRRLTECRRRQSAEDRRGVERRQLLPNASIAAQVARHQAAPERRNPPFPAGSLGALCRTRTGDPFLTMAVPRRSRMRCAEPKCPQRAADADLQPPAPIRTVRHPPVPREYLKLAAADTRSWPAAAEASPRAHSGLLLSTRFRPDTGVDRGGHDEGFRQRRFLRGSLYRSPRNTLNRGRTRPEVLRPMGQLCRD